MKKTKDITSPIDMHDLYSKCKKCENLCAYEDKYLRYQTTFACKLSPEYALWKDSSWFGTSPPGKGCPHYKTTKLYEICRSCEFSRLYTLPQSISGPCTKGGIMFCCDRIDSFHPRCISTARIVDNKLKSFKAEVKRYPSDCPYWMEIKLLLEGMHNDLENL